MQNNVLCPLFTLPIPTFTKKTGAMEDGAIKTQSAQALTEGSDAAPTEEGEQQLKGLGGRMGVISKGQQTRQRLVFSH